MDESPSSPGTDERLTRPCVYCGRPVPQRAAAGRPYRYCRDNDDACMRAARNSRMRERNSPGLSGQIARAWETVERLELLTGTLADALHSELSPAGVERQVNAVRAEAAAALAASHQERDEARREAQIGRQDSARHAQVAADAKVAAAHAEEAAQAATAEAVRQRERTARAEKARDEATHAARAAEALREAAKAEKDAAVAAQQETESLLRDVEASRDELIRHNAGLIRERNDIKRANELLRAEHAKVQDSVEALRQRVETATLERDQLQFANARLAQDAARDQAAASASAQETAAAREAHARAVRERDRAQWERDAATQEATRANAAHAVLEQEKAAALARIAEVTATLRAAETARDAARDHAAEVLNRIDGRVKG